MSTKRKGTTAERELVHLLWEQGYACVRVAGSGSTTHPSPDVLASNGIRTFAIECKSITDGTRYIPKAEIEQLEEFGLKFGAETFFAVRFNRKEWHFLHTCELKDRATLKLSKDEVALKGMLLSELLGLGAS